MNQENRIHTIFKNLVDSNSMWKELRKSIKPVGTGQRTMHGLCKVHKQEVDGSPKYRRIVLDLETPTYNPVEISVFILHTLTKTSIQLKTHFILIKRFVSRSLQIYGQFRCRLTFYHHSSWWSCWYLHQLAIWKHWYCGKFHKVTTKTTGMFCYKGVLFYIQRFTLHTSWYWNWWDHFLDFPWLTHFCHTRKNLVKQLPSRT